MGGARAGLAVTWRGADRLGLAGQAAVRCDQRLTELKENNEMPTKVKNVTNNGDDEPTMIGPVSSAANFTIAHAEPYMATVDLEGTSALLFHRWQCESVAAKAAAAKGSAAKKTDDIESYVWRCHDGTIGLPGEYLRGAICGPAGAAKYRQDPRSPRKSALDLYKAAVVSLTDVASLGAKDWDYLDQRRVTVQRQGVTRVRPAFLPGWHATFDLQVLLPEYVSSADLLDVITKAGQLVGVGDFRPTFGRFQVTNFKVWST